MNFEHALEHLRKGGRACRAGWNGKGMFIYLVMGSQFTVNRAPLLGIYPEGHRVTYQPHIDMMTAQGSAVPWLASQTDLLAVDWLLMPREAEGRMTASEVVSRSEGRACGCGTGAGGETTAADLAGDAYAPAASSLGSQARALLDRVHEREAGHMRLERTLTMLANELGSSIEELHDRAEDLAHHDEGQVKRRAELSQNLVRPFAERTARPFEIKAGAVIGESAGTMRRAVRGEL